jgi:hypothetical protein
MAQAIKNKEIRKNCIDVENVIMECLYQSKSADHICLEEPVESLWTNKEKQKFMAINNTKLYQEVIPINQIDQRVVYRNFMLKY